MNLPLSSLSLSSVEQGAPQVEDDLAVGVAESPGEDMHLRAVRQTAEDRPGAQNRCPAAVGSFDRVVIVAGGDVQPAVVSDGHPRHLLQAEAAARATQAFADAAPDKQADAE